MKDAGVSVRIQSAGLALRIFGEGQSKSVFLRTWHRSGLGIAQKLTSKFMDLDGIRRFHPSRIGSKSAAPVPPIANVVERSWRLHRRGHVVALGIQVIFRQLHVKANGLQ